MKGPLTCFGMMGTLNTYNIGFLLAYKHGLVHSGLPCDFAALIYYTVMGLYLGIMILVVMGREPQGIRV